MRRLPNSQRFFLGLLLALCTCIGLAAILGWALQAGHGRGAVIRYFERSTGRRLQVHGALHLRFFSSHPSLSVQQVVIGNPPWMPRGETADLASLSVSFEWPGLHHGIAVTRLEITGSSLHLERDAAGNANWQWTDPKDSRTRDLPIVQNLSMPNARVVLRDDRRHLSFDGTISVEDAPAAAGSRSLKLTGTGLLNDRPVAFTVDGDDLATSSHDRPYHFHFSEQSSGSHLTGQGSLPHPFDFGALDASFEAAGADLRDLYFLTGVAVINTGRYQLFGQYALRGSKSIFSSLTAKSGSSEAHGSVTIDSVGGRPTADIELSSSHLNLADVGLRAAGRELPSDDPPRLLLSDATLSPSTLRNIDSTIRFHARQVDVGKVSLNSVAATLSVNRAILTLSSLTAKVLGGTLLGHLQMDATKDDPRTRLDLKFNDLHLEGLAPAGRNPPIEGPLSVYILLTGGHGTSLHQVAASANGSVTAFLPQGALRSSLAELTGIDLRGIGLLLSKSDKQTVIRCGLAKFQATDGLLVAQDLMLDTESLFITGTGTVQLKTEALELQLHGSPKHLRIFRLPAPLRVHGTLLHPLVSLEKPPSLKVVDLGKAADAACEPPAPR